MVEMWSIQQTCWVLLLTPAEFKWSAPHEADSFCETCEIYTNWIISDWNRIQWITPSLVLITSRSEIILSVSSGKSVNQVIWERGSVSGEVCRWEVNSEHGLLFLMNSSCFQLFHHREQINCSLQNKTDERLHVCYGPDWTHSWFSDLPLGPTLSFLSQNSNKTVFSCSVYWLWPGQRTGGSQEDIVVEDHGGPEPHQFKLLAPAPVRNPEPTLKIIKTVLYPKLVWTMHLNQHIFEKEIS